MTWYDSVAFSYWMRAKCGIVVFGSYAMHAKSYCKFSLFMKYSSPAVNSIHCLCLNGFLRMSPTPPQKCHRLGARCRARGLFWKAVLLYSSSYSNSCSTKRVQSQYERIFLICSSVKYVIQFPNSSWRPLVSLTDVARQFCISHAEVMNSTYKARIPLA